MQRHSVVLDLDTGLDDAIALIVALMAPGIQVAGITTVNGNCLVETCTDNTLRVLDYLEAEIPVYEGLARPLENSYFRSEPSPTHGATIDLPEARTGKRSMHAVDWLISMLLASDEAITLVCVAPLTNIATAISQEPAILPKIRELVIMGGGHAVSNMTPASEFNIWIDAEAAKIVLACGRPIRLVTLDATYCARISRSDLDKLANLGTRAGDLTAHLLRPYIEAYDRQQPRDLQGTAPLHDPLAVAALIDPALLETRFVHVDVEVRGKLTYGRTVCDLYGLSESEPNAHVAVKADRKRFIEVLLETMSAPRTN